MASTAAMKTTLVVMLLLAAVVASHARAVTCKNSSPTDVTVCGTHIPKGHTTIVHVQISVTLAVTDKHGKMVNGTYSCPKDVNALYIVYEHGYLKLKVAGIVKGLLGLVGTLLGLLLGSLKCSL